VDGTERDGDRGFAGDGVAVTILPSPRRGEGLGVRGGPFFLPSPLRGRGVGGEGAEASAMRHDPRSTERARSLRRDLSPAEKLVWKELRGRRFAGFKFRRQQPIGQYIVDFYCSGAALVLELDGETHLGREAHDATRQQWLERQGLKVLRFWNNQVFEDKQAVLEAIWRECGSRSKGRPLTPNPSPPQGRGETRWTTQ
jgi:adenine-specific DNA-methyltransferase